LVLGRLRAPGPAGWVVEARALQLNAMSVGRTNEQTVPSCVLRISVSTEGELDSVLEWFPVKPLAVFRKGRPVTPASSRIGRSTGVNFLVSDHDGTNIDLQVEDAQKFLVAYHEALMFVSRMAGLEGIALDFGSEIPRDILTREHVLPWTLLAACAEARISIYVSVYPTDDGD
jgi:hypothetical protein